jgi:hypothetical protein
MSKELLWTFETQNGNLGSIQFKLDGKKNVRFVCILGLEATH